MPGSAIYNIELFNGLTGKELDTLLTLAHNVTVNCNDIFISEADDAEYLYVMLTGTAEVLKNSHDHSRQHRLAVIGAGQPIGEISLLDNAPRSASLRALEPVTLLAIAIGPLHSNAEFAPIYHKILANLAKVVASRLREVNEVTVVSLENELQANKQRVSMGLFLVTMLYVISLYLISMSQITVSVISWQQLLIPIIVSVIFAIICVLCIQKSNTPPKEFGLTLQNWQLHLLEGILLTIPLICCVIFTKWFVLTIVAPTGTDMSIFSNEVAYVAHSNPSGYALTLILFFVSCGLQELLARAGLQMSIHRFLGEHAKHSMWSAIILSNLILAAAHFYVSPTLAMAVLLPGIFWGWLFAKQRSLVGVTISHFLLGIFLWYVAGAGLLF